MMSTLPKLAVAADQIRSRLGSSSEWSRSVGLAVRITKDRGLRGLARAVAHSLFPHLRAKNYAKWVAKYDTLDAKDLVRLRTIADRLPERPLFSIVVPVFDPPPDALRAAIESVRAQVYDHWQLCIADDASRNPEVRHLLEEYQALDKRIEVAFRPSNGHISASSNTALEMAKGTYVVLFDHDDLLPADALLMVAATINRHPNAKMLYSDEDKISVEGQRFDPYFKPDWNLGLMYGHNMFSHLGVYRTDLVRAVGGFRAGLEGAQDYDLTLRCAEKVSPEEIVHIPHVLYHWRTLPTSTATKPEAKSYAIRAAEKAINEHLERIGVPGRAQEFDGRGMTRLSVRATPPPSVSIIIPTKNSSEILSRCLESVLERTNYPNFEVMVIDNGSTSPAALAVMDTFAAKGVRILKDPSPFNYSALNNRAVAQCTTDFVCLLNDDTEVITPGWLTEMIGCALLPQVGAVGAKLLYPNNTIQHAGVVLGLGGVAGHIYAGEPADTPGMMWRASLSQEMTAVTGACLLVRRQLYLDIGGLNEEALAIAYNDVDFCLRLREKGYRNYWTPNATLYHHESLTRGSDVAAENLVRFGAEVNYMRNRWRPLIDDDPSFSKNLSLEKNGTDYATPPRADRLDYSWLAPASPN